MWAIQLMKIALLGSVTHSKAACPGGNTQQSRTSLLTAREQEGKQGGAGATVPFKDTTLMTYRSSHFLKVPQPPRSTALGPSLATWTFRGELRPRRQQNRERASSLGPSAPHLDNAPADERPSLNLCLLCLNPPSNLSSPSCAPVTLLCGQGMWFQLSTHCVGLLFHD